MYSIPYSRLIKEIERNARPLLIHTVTYLTDKKQALFEGLPGQMRPLGANFSAPEIKGFPHFEALEEGDADQLAVVFILLFPALEGYEL